MLKAVLDVVTGAGILLAVFAIWLGVQHLKRKTEELPPDCDVLSQSGHGCPHCNLHGRCTLERELNAKT